MKLNYYVLWVEDDDSWFKTTSELFSETIIDYGFNPIIERRKSLDGVVNQIVDSGLKKFDIFLIDFKLRNSADGDNIIDHVRNSNIFTDIIFYSSDKQSIVDSIREHLFEGVYHSDRKELEDKFEKVFKTTIKKIEEINSMRGLIVGETSELDALIEEHLITYTQSPFIEKFDLKKFIEKEIVNNLEKRKDKIDELYKSDGLTSILPHIDAAKKWQMLRGILKKNTDYKIFIPEFIEKNSTYFDEVIDVRNKFAHSQVLVKDGGKEVLKALIGEEHFEFDEDSFKKIREDLIKHRNALVKLKG
ncbi:hypothetical protein SAMN05660845_2193 [Flavobacterium swingsii]|uniref:Response regulator receiver domain-containing protein n=1 Tax=Flavobacterium swingsii TaxID=498292 RepID=A0A1I0ZEF5_9FLAO|nr:hypothetical protein [Flavobacterium swingsii]SFB23506.1 hypothetical protein SAMN05660845_2193 [Flavobacterium swingsii]